jgi:hypothetical protein
LNSGLIHRNRRKIGLGNPPIFAVESDALAWRDETYFWCCRFGEYRRNDKREQSKRCASHSRVFNRLFGRGKELKRQCRARIAPRIVFDCRMANDPAMMPSMISAQFSR